MNFPWKPSRFNELRNEENAEKNEKDGIIELRPVKVGNSIVGRHAIKKHPDVRTNLRKHAVEQLVLYRHGGPCNTDDGEIYLSEVLPYLIDIARHRGVEIRSETWAAKFTPRLLVNGIDWFRTMENSIEARPYRFPSNDEFARNLSIRQAEVEALVLRSIRSIDLSPAEAAQIRRTKKRAAEKSRRIAAGATPREQSIRATRPWLVAGYRNEKAWRRAIKLGRVPPHPAMRTQRAKSRETSDTGSICPNIVDTNT
jgi:hypothetical protein